MNLSAEPDEEPAVIVETDTPPLPEPSEPVPELSGSTLAEEPAEFETGRAPDMAILPLPVGVLSRAIAITDGSSTCRAETICVSGERFGSPK